MGTRSARRRRRLFKEMVRDEHSAGGVVVRPREQGGWEVLLIATHEGGRWSLPKGHVEEGESEVEAAVREVEEETGVRAESIAPLETLDYWYRWKGPEGSMLVHKRVTYFLMRYLSGDVQKHGWEVDDARWFPFEEAVEKLTYKDERRLLAKARALLEQEQKEHVQRTPS